MKIHFDLEATLQELRTFFGLPDVEPPQQQMLDVMRRNMAAGMAGFDPVALVKPWLPPISSPWKHSRNFFGSRFRRWTASTGLTKTGE